jgi:hypothetical protein
VSTDAVFFDPGYSTANCTINANISVKGISINSGYTGTVTQSSGNTVTVGTSGYSQADGTFAGGIRRLMLTPLSRYPAVHLQARLAH